MHEYTKRWPELEEFLKEIDERIYKAMRPADEVIHDDVDLRNILKISKRQAAKLRAEKRITYFKSGGKIYYTLADILNYVKKFKVSAADSNFKIKNDGKR